MIETSVAEREACFSTNAELRIADALLRRRNAAVARPA